MRGWARGGRVMAAAAMGLGQPSTARPRGHRGRPRLLAPGHISGAAIYCPSIAPETRLAHKAIHTQQWGFSQQLTRNNIIKPFTKPRLFTIN